MHGLGKGQYAGIDAGNAQRGKGRRGAARGGAARHLLQPRAGKHVHCPPPPPHKARRRNTQSRRRNTQSRRCNTQSRRRNTQSRRRNTQSGAQTAWRLMRQARPVTSRRAGPSSHARKQESQSPHPTGTPPPPLPGHSKARCAAARTRRFRPVRRVRGQGWRTRRAAPRAAHRGSKASRRRMPHQRAHGAHGRRRGATGGPTSPALQRDAARQTSPALLSPALQRDAARQRRTPLGHVCSCRCLVTSSRPLHVRLQDADVIALRRRDSARLASPGTAPPH